MSPEDIARTLLAEATDLPAAEIGPGLSIHSSEAWTSMAHLRLILALEAQLGRQLPPSAVAEIAGFDDLVDILAAA